MTDVVTVRVHVRNPPFRSVEHDLRREVHFSLGSSLRAHMAGPPKDIVDRDDVFVPTVVLLEVKHFQMCGPALRVGEDAYMCSGSCACMTNGGWCQL